MSDPTERLWTALSSGASPIIVVLYGDMGLIHPARDAIDAVADPSWPVVDCHTVDEALNTPADTLVRLLPYDEASAISDLEGNRERFIDRIAPVVVLLRHKGAGVDQLALSPSLGSWVRDSTVDLTAREDFDLDAQRARFEAETGQTPEAWLDSRDDGASMDRTALDRQYWALTLERRSDVG